MPKTKHTKKYNSSEVLNSTNKTNKYINLYNTILKKKQYNKLNTNVDNKTIRQYNKNSKHGRNQKGGDGIFLNPINKSTVFGTSVGERDITSYHFSVINKQQYKQLKKDIKATMSKAFIAKKKKNY